MAGIRGMYGHTIYDFTQFGVEESGTLSRDEQFAAPAFTWRAHPARERVGHALAAIGVLAAFAAAVHAFCGAAGAGLAETWAWSVGTLVAGGLALNRFLLPSTFTIDDEGITAHYPLRVQRLLWRDLKRFVHDDRGGYLSTRYRASRFDAFTGMHLVFGSDRQMIIDRINACMRRGDVL